MSMDKIANYYYNLGRQKAAQDMLGNIRTKTAAPKISNKQLAALLGGSAAAGAGGLGLKKYLAGLAPLTGDTLQAGRQYNNMLLRASEVPTIPASGFGGIAEGTFDDLANYAAKYEGLGEASSPLNQALMNRVAAEQALLESVTNKANKGISKANMSLGADDAYNSLRAQLKAIGEGGTTGPKGGAGADALYEAMGRGFVPNLTDAAVLGKVPALKGALGALGF